MFCQNFCCCSFAFRLLDNWIQTPNTMSAGGQQWTVISLASDELLVKVSPVSHQWHHATPGGTTPLSLSWEMWRRRRWPRGIQPLVTWIRHAIMGCRHVYDNMYVPVGAQLRCHTCGLHRSAVGCGCCGAWWGWGSGGDKLPGINKCLQTFDDFWKETRLIVACKPWKINVI